jgi:glycine cleavage system aminomethyltransferase T
VSDRGATSSTARTRTSLPTLRSPLASIHASAGADVVSEGGAEAVRSYGDPVREGATVAAGIGLADITVRAKIDVRGDVDRAISPMPGEVSARIAGDWTLLFSPPGSVTQRVASMQAAAGTSAMVTDVTHLYAGFALAGPALPDALARLTSWDPSTLEAGAATGAPIADVRAVVMRREATSVPLVEVWVAMEFARYAWRSIQVVVERLGGEAIGWDALRGLGWR